jgi:hypothetical protein
MQLEKSVEEYMTSAAILPSDEIPGAVADEVVWIFPDRSLQYFSPVLEVRPGFIDGCTRKRWETSQSLEVHTSQTPVINRELVVITLQYFGSHIVGRSNNGLSIVDILVSHRSVTITSLCNSSLVHRLAERHICFPDLLKLDSHGLNLSRGQETSSKSKVGELDMPSRVDQEVLGLKISVNVTKLMKGIDGTEHLCNIETRMSVCKYTSIVEQSAEISTRNVLLGFR